MARFDFNPLQTVSPSGQPMPEQRIGAATPKAFGADIGAAQQDAAGALAGLGRTLAQTGDVANQHALAFQELNNETAAKDADNAYQTKLRGLGFGAEGKPGFFATAGQAAFDGSVPTIDEADKIKNEILDGLPNEAARFAAKRSLDARYNSFSESVASHGAQGRKEWMLSTSQARQANAVANAADYYNDPAKINLNIAVAKGEAISQGELLGHSAEQNMLEQRKVESDIHTAVIDRMMTDNPLDAQKYYASHIDGIVGEQHAKIERSLKAATMPILTRNIADAQMNGAPAPNPDLIATVAQAESGGKDRNPDGSVITSPKGAKGIMQVLDGTNKDPGFGIVPAKDESLAERQRVGQEYLTAMLQRYGNQTVALAAYNWGPGNVDNLLATMGSGPGKSGMVDGEAFLARTPQETRNYVTGINAKMPPVPGKPPTSDDIKDHYNEYVERTKAAARASGMNPVEVDQAVQQTQQNMNEIIRGQTYAEQSARNLLTAKVNGFVIGADGGYHQVPVSQRPQNLADLLKDPAAAKAWATMDPLQQAAINARIGKDDVPETQATISKYHDLMGMAQVDPDGFGKINFASAQYMDTLPKANIMALQKEQLQMSSKQGRDLAKSSTWNNAMAIAKQIPGWKEAGLPMSIGPKTSNAQKGSYQQFGSRLYNMVQDWQGEHKKAIPHDEVVKMASSLLVQGTIPGAGFLGMDKHTPVFNIAPNDAQKTQIAAAFQRQMGRPPRPAEIDRIYQNHVLKHGVPK